MGTGWEQPLLPLSSEGFTGCVQAMKKLPRHLPDRLCAARGCGAGSRQLSLCCTPLLHRELKGATSKVTFGKMPAEQSRPWRCWGPQAALVSVSCSVSCSLHHSAELVLPGPGAAQRTHKHKL